MFGAVKLTKNTGVNNYRFDGHGSFSYPGIVLGKNEMVFGVDMSSSTKIDNRKKRYFNFG